MQDWLTTILIFLPIAGGIVIALAPLPSYWLGSLAALVSLVEVGFWITAAGKFDFGSPSLQFAQDRFWFSDLNVSYHVGQYAFSLWLVGMTVVVMAACTIYGWWAGRERARAYFALMLFTTGAIVGVFTAQDLRALLRVLRGDADPALRPDRRLGRRRPHACDADVRHLYGRRLAADARGDHRVRPPAGHVRPDAHGAEQLDVALPGLRDRVRDQGAALPVPRLAPWRLPRVTARGVGAALRRGLESGPLRPPADRDREVPVGRRRLARGAARPRCDLTRLWLAARLPCARLPGRRPVLVARAVRIDRARAVGGERPRLRRSRAADGQPWPHLGVAVPRRRDGRAAHGHRGAGQARRDGARAARARNRAHDDRDHRARGAALDLVRG